MSANILDGTGHGPPSPVDARGGPEGERPNFIKVGQIVTNAATPAEVSLDNIKANVKRGLTRLHQLPEFDSVRQRDEPIALVGGGPSLKQTINELRNWKAPIVACGSSHDFIVENGIIPHYCVVCDPDPVMASYLTKANKKTTFLLSSAVDPLVFDSLKGHKVVLWHCHSEANEKMMQEIDVDYQAVGGGCTVGLRSLSIAIVFGYNNIHFFGFDSCMSAEQHHAYDFNDHTKEFLGDTYRIRIGFNGPGDKVYTVAGYQLAQAENFKNFYNKYGMYFTPVFHGPGLLADIMETVKKKSETVTVTTPETLGVQA